MLGKLKFHLKGIIGLVLGAVFPNKRKLVKQYATIPWHYKPGFGKLERFIRAGILYSKAGRPARQNALMGLHQYFWTNQLATEYYANTSSRFQEVFVPNFSKYLDRLDSLVEEHNVSAVCEIGTGDGQLLSHIAGRWPSKNCVGLDLSTDQIEINKQTYMNRNIQFASGDAIDCIKAHSPQATLYITGLGVLEYFDYEKLVELLRLIKSKHPRNMLFLTEPVYDGVDVDQDFDSFSGGSEHSFTHAYPKILEREGWRLIQSDTVVTSEHRFWAGIAVDTDTR